MSSVTETYLAYTYGSTTSTLTTLTASQIPHRSPGKGEIKIQVCASALNPVDVQLAGWKGMLKFAIDWFASAPIKEYESQKIPGADLSGVVVATGEGVDQWKVGDEVFGWDLSLTGNGTNQEYIILSATSALVPKPSNLSHAEAASLPLVFLTSYASLLLRGGLDYDSNLNARQGTKVLILGASGGTGIFGVQIAKYFGAHVVAVCSGKNADFVRSHGANEVIDYTTEDVPSATISHGPYKVVYDCVGGTELMPHLTTLLAPRSTELGPTSSGTYVTIVGDKTSRTIMGGSVTYLSSPRMFFRTLLGTVGLGPRYYCVNLTAGEEELGALLRLSAEGKVKPVIDGEPFGREQIREAYAKLESGRAKGKIVVDWEKA